MLSEKLTHIAYVATARSYIRYGNHLMIYPCTLTLGYRISVSLWERAEGIAGALQVPHPPDPLARESKREMQAVSGIARGEGSRFGIIEGG